MDVIKYKGSPLQHFRINKILDPLAINPCKYEVAKIAAVVAESTDKAIVNAIVAAAREEGITDLYLIDETFIIEAIRGKMEKEDAGFTQVVRCKDCKYLLPDDWDGEILYGCGCTSGMDSPYLEGFCSYGERKEGDHG